MLELYENIKKYRLERHLTQSQLADLVGYSDKGMISRVENGKVDLPQSQIQKFADALNVTPKDLMGWDEGTIGDVFASYRLFADAFSEIFRRFEDLNKNHKGIIYKQEDALSTDESELLNTFRSLNTQGQQKLMERSRELLNLGYQRGAESQDSILDGKVG